MARQSAQAKAAWIAGGFAVVAALIVAGATLLSRQGGSSTPNEATDVSTGDSGQAIAIRDIHDSQITIEPAARATESPTPDPSIRDGFKIAIVKRYRPRFVFVISSAESDHFVVNRLYLQYLAEYQWEPAIPPIEALMFRKSYALHLSRKFAEYDLLPQTADNLVHEFEYNGREADSFGIQVYGTDVCKVQIVADVYDVRRDKTFTIKSEEIRIVTSGSMSPLWDKPLPVAPNRLLDSFEPLAYKAFTHMDWKGFVDSMDSKGRKGLVTQLQQLLGGGEPVSSERLTEILEYAEKDPTG